MSNRMKNDFIKSDQIQAAKELDCYNHCIAIAEKKHEEGKYSESAAYLENAARSLRELQMLKNNKEMYDEAQMMLKQVDANKKEFLGWRTRREKIYRK